ncbi:hypothetical protein ACEWY4_006035 [Coilia grayii]|uniref:Integrase zinc-binding domain-containing protein n=1 Tax=Coilia grayii TaxID=363190 RepID=A0ABD1KDA3_9TELE
MPEEEIVRRIHNVCNPRLASSLWGIVSTVEQLVKVGSLIEKDGGNSKDYWTRVQQSNPTDCSTKKQSKKAAEMSVVLGAPTLLVVLVAVRGSRAGAVLDTGSTYSVMTKTLWENIRKGGETLYCTGNQKFLMANGQESKALGKVSLLLTLNNTHCTVDVFILEDSQLCLPLLLGLDFMCTSQLVLKPHQGQYVMPGGRAFQFLQKTRDALEWKHHESPALFYMALDEVPSKHPPAVPLLKQQTEVVRPLLQSSLQEVEEAQTKDGLCQDLVQSVADPTPGRIHFHLQQGVLYRGVPSKYGGYNYQMVVPAVLIPEFLAYFHDSPFGGHLGRMETLQKILEVAWWPDVRRDV